LEVTCTTTLLSSAVGMVGGSAVRVHAIIPGASCPGHFDLSPSDARGVSRSRLFLYHGFERFIKRLGALGQTSVRQVAVKGSWLVPEVQIRALERVAEILGESLPEKRGYFRENATRRAAEIRLFLQRRSSQLASFRDVPVVCSVMNREFVEWLGCQVVGTFPRDENLSVQALQRAIEECRRSPVRLVLDNLQSHGKTGLTLARELKRPLIMLSNFPRQPDQSNPYLLELESNLKQMSAALNPKP
jgi:zinc transport system substrate-binding protein